MVVNKILSYMLIIRVTDDHHMIIIVTDDHKVKYVGGEARVIDGHKS